MSTYLGALVLDVTEPDRAGGSSDRSTRKIFELDSQSGMRSFDAASPADSLVRQFEWVCFSRAEVKVLRDFIDTCAGRAVPFWLRTWERDFNMTINSNGRFYVVSDVRYASLVFPLGNYRRHVSIRADSGTFHHRRVINAASNGNGTETLTIESGTFETVSPPGLVSFLRYSRLDSDEIRIDWEGGAFARAVLPIRELPNEVPA